MLIKIYPENPNTRQIDMVVNVLKDGGIIIYPTDTVYAIGCDMMNKQAIDNLCRVINKNPETANLSIICSDLSNLSQYTVPFEDRIFRMMRKSLPGPYTWILKANQNIPKIFKNKKKTIGIRVPNNSIPLEIVTRLGNPIVSASIHGSRPLEEYLTDPLDIKDEFEYKVDIIIDGGFGGNVVSTILDCSDGEITLIRQGKGEVELND
jgi:tRNA threonylcarbamoyl adenosine modification protein (Sua5/YciO/YrdC/YwlC family)